MSDPLELVLQTLQALDDAATTAGIWNAYIEVWRNEHELVVGGDRAGLIHLALQMLSLAQRGTPGSHIHIDESSGADRCAVPLVVRYAERP